MELEINTIKDDNTKVQVVLREKGRLILEKEVFARMMQSEKLLPLIERAIRESHKKIQELSMIKVQHSGGSFTSLRIGIATANALGFALGIPVKPLQTSKNKNNILIVNNRTLILPAYSGKPNITKSKIKK